jgi:hypothetical protein
MQEVIEVKANITTIQSYNNSIRDLFGELNTLNDEIDALIRSGKWTGEAQENAARLHDAIGLYYDAIGNLLADAKTSADNLIKDSAAFESRSENVALAKSL